jgi:hypothetical protein
VRQAIMVLIDRRVSRSLLVEDARGHQPTRSASDCCVPARARGRMPVVIERGEIADTTR